MAGHGSNGHGAAAKLAEFKEKSEASKRWIDTIEFHHVGAYHHMAGKHLLNDEGEIDYERLETDETQEQATESIIEHLLDKAFEAYGINKKNPKFDPNKVENYGRVNSLLQGYAGVTKGQVRDLVAKSGKALTVDAFSKQMANVRSQLAKQFEAGTYEHITKEDIPGLVTALELDGKVDPERMELDDIVELMSGHHVNKGVISPNQYEHKLYAIKEKKEHAPAHH